MKKIINLVKVLYKNNKNDSGKMKPKSKTLLSIVLAIYIFVIFANFWGLFISPLEEAGKPELSIDLMMTLISIFMFVTSITYVVNVLYFSNDIENILPFPFKPKEIFTAKIFTVYLYELLISAMFLLPGFISYGYHMKESIIFYIYSLIILMIIPIIPILIITIITTVLMQIFKFIKYKNFFKIVSTIIMIAIVVVFELNLNSNMDIDGGYKSEYILGMVEDFNSGMPYYLETASIAIRNIGDFSGLISIIWFVIINVSTLVIVILLFNKLYLKGIFYNMGGEERKYTSSKKNVYKLGSSYKAIVNKDIKNLFRNTTYFIQCVLPVFLMPVIILLMTTTSNENAVEMLEMNGTLKLMVGIIIIQFFMIMNYISLTAISRDRKAEATYMKTLPISFEKQIRAKALPSVLIGIIGVVIALIFSYNMLQLSISESGILLVMGILLNIVQSYIYVLIDLVHPKLNCESEIAIVKQNINIFYGILITIGMIILTSIFGSLFIEIDPIYFVISYSIFNLIIYGILRVVIKKNSEKLYMKII